MVLIFFLITLGYFTISNKHYKLVIIIIFSFFLGASLWQKHHYKQQYYERLFSSHTLDIIGTIINKEELEQKKRLDVKITQFHTQLNQEWRSINTIIMIYSNTDQPSGVGDTIKITKLKCAPLNKPLQDWLRSHNRTAIAFQTSTMQLIHHPSYSLARTLFNYKKYLSQQLNQKLSYQAYGLVTSIFLGKPDKTNEFSYHESFSWWGLNHYLARAGLHLIILFLILSILGSLFTSRFIIKTILTISIATAYYLLTWHNLPFIRAFIVFINYQLCHVLKIPINSIHILNLVLLAYLFVSPQALFTLDFQLTFAITYTLVNLGKYTKIFTSP